MANLCPVSTRLSLTNIIQKLYCSEFAPQLCILPPRSLLRPTHHRLKNTRSFSSGSPRCSLHPVTSTTSQLELSANTDSPRPIPTDENADVELAQESKTRTSPALFTAAKGKPTRRQPHLGQKDVSKDRLFTDLRPKKKREAWQTQKDSLKKKFEAGWSPPKKLSPDALEGIRHLHAVAPDRFTTPVLAEQFKVSPEAIRRILKSKWRPSESELEDRRKRWENRHERIWSHMTELGLRPKSNRAEPLTDASGLFYNKSNNGGGKSKE